MALRPFWTLLLLAVAAHAATPTFTRDVAPILFHSCAPCHRPGEAAPFPLLTYQDAARHATQIAEVTTSRYMPPWPPEPGKGDFLGSRRLSPAQLQILQAWAQAGAPQGDPRDLPPTPAFTEGWQLGPPDLILTLDRPYTLPANGSDVFRNFVFPVPLHESRYVRAIEIRPGNKRIVHHANLLIDRSGQSRRRDALDPEPGFPGMDVVIESRTFEPDSHFLFWKPGTTAAEEPTDLALTLRPGTDLVLNAHLQPAGKPELLQPSIGIYFTNTPPTKAPMLVQMERDDALNIPANAKNFEVTDRLTLPTAADLLAIYPHAHYLGHDVEAWADLPNGKTLPLLHIADWDINWQAVYRYREPIHLPKGATIHMRWRYDNTAANPRNPHQPPQRVLNGDRSQDEMAHLWLQLLPQADNPGTDPRRTLHRATLERRLEKDPQDFFAIYSIASLQQDAGELEPALSLYQKALALRPTDATALNATGTALLALNRINEAQQRFEAALRADPASSNAHYNLARIDLANDRFDPAIAHLREAIRLDPDDAIAWSDLGAALFATNRTSEAIPALRTAIKLNPAYVPAHYNLAQALEALGQTTEAVRELRQAAQLDPQDPDVRDSLRRLTAKP